MDKHTAKRILAQNGITGMRGWLVTLFYLRFLPWLTDKLGLTPLVKRHMGRAMDASRDAAADAERLREQLIHSSVREARSQRNFISLARETADDLSASPAERDLARESLGVMERSVRMDGQEHRGERFTTLMQAMRSHTRAEAMDWLRHYEWLEQGRVATGKTYIGEAHTRSVIVAFAKLTRSDNMFYNALDELFALERAQQPRTRRLSA